MQSVNPHTVAPTENPGAIVPLAALRAAMAAALPLVHKRNPIPLLSNVRILGNGSRVFLTVSDLDMEFSQAVDAPCDSRLRFTVPAHVLADMCKAAPNVDAAVLESPVIRSFCNIDSRQLREEVESRARIRFGERTSFGLESLPACDFPVMNRDPLRSESARHFTMSGADFLDGIDSTNFAVSTEATRFYLNGIFIHETDAGNLGFAATDGHRLSVREFEMPQGGAGLNGSGNERGVILPRAACVFLHRALKGKSCPESVDISISPSMVRVRWGNSVLLSKVIDGTFPDYVRVIPTQNDKALRVDTAELASAIKAVSKVSSTKGRAVRLVMESDRLQVSMSDPDSGESSAELSCGYDEDRLEIGFKSEYLADILATIQNGRKGVPATIWLREPGDPALAFGREGCRIVLMPMRV